MERTFHEAFVKARGRIPAQSSRGILRVKRAGEPRTPSVYNRNVLKGQPRLKSFAKQFHAPARFNIRTFHKYVNFCSTKYNRRRLVLPLRRDTRGKRRGSIVLPSLSSLSRHDRYTRISRTLFPNNSKEREREGKEKKVGVSQNFNDLSTLLLLLPSPFLPY